MQQSDLDTAVESAASNLAQEDIRGTQVAVETEISDECWNRNRPLNMIAYEDQR